MVNFNNVSLIFDDKITSKPFFRSVNQDDILSIIKKCSDETNLVFNPGTSEYTCHGTKGYLTYWIRFKKIGSGSERSETSSSPSMENHTVYQISGLYYHRITIE